MYKMVLTFESVNKTATVGIQVKASFLVLFSIFVVLFSCYVSEKSLWSP